MGYYDENFGAHFWFAIKFLLGLVAVRLVIMALGYTAYWPVLDDIILFGYRLFSTAVKLITEASQAVSPSLP